MLRFNPRYQLFLALSDALIVVVSLLLASFVRLRIDLGMEAVPSVFETPPALLVITPLIWLFAFGRAGVYRVNSRSDWTLVLRRIGIGHVLAGMSFLGVLYLIYRDYSRLQSFYFLAIALAMVLLHRGTLLLFSRRLSKAINTRRRVLIIGTGANARLVGAVIREGEPLGLHLLGYVPADDDEPADDAHAPVVCTLEGLAEYARAGHVDEIIIALRWFDQSASDLVSRVMRDLEQVPVNIRVAPDYSELAYFNANPENFNGVTLVGLRERVLTPTQRILKRLFDIAFSGALLLLASPLLLLIAVAIRRDSPGPVIYRQKRVGQHGKHFVIYKFRSMYQDADARTAGMTAEELAKYPDDPRVTRIGRLLRRTSLDELPQFVNVLKGDMSVVGPRPEVLSLAERYEWWQRKRFEVPQGITGWWQVTGRSDKPMQFNIEDDLYYVRHFSLWLDFQILLRTVLAVFSGRGAY
ncbi:MAG: sugar transferase [Pleurocapsa minor GSE-CHR-MK-17-07R]|jgi:exopolysaccharide biosynthesis polyprenyl glycosylphosphotransferase|nr:sugar transferase [Pleurocapsa minor GSE-CHR-MK 17-07R]